MMSITVVRILNSGFVVTPSPDFVHLLRDYLKRMYRYEFRKTAKRVGGAISFDSQRELKEKWCIELPNINEYRIHISYLTDFKVRFKDVKIDYLVSSLNPADKVSFAMVSSFSPRGEQPDWIEFLSTHNGQPHKALPATMGAGKTITFLAVLSEIGYRAYVMLPPFLSSRWLSEIEKFTDLDKKEYVYISGGTSLKSYMTTLEMGRNPFSIVLFSITTMRNYFRDYYINPEEFIYSPQEFFAKAGFGVRGIDEAHKELHFHFTSTLYANCSRYIALSGTLDKDNEYLCEMGERLFPEDGRCPVGDVVASTDCVVYKMYYDTWTPKHMSSMGYSHVQYENQIRFNPTIRNAYFLYLAKIVYAEFVSKIVKDSDKCLVFMATVKLADMFDEFLRENAQVKDAFSSYNVGRLRAAEDDSKCDDLDIVITTVQRTGTGTDIPGLLTVFNTIPIADSGLQRQVLGRGRPRDDINPRYIRLYSPTIRKHVQYNVESLRILNDLCTSVTMRELPGSMPNPTTWDKEQAKKTEGLERMLRNSKAKGTKARKASRRKR